MGGWASAAQLPADESLAWAEDLLRERQFQAHQHATQVWAATLPAYALGGGTPPDPPEPPED